MTDEWLRRRQISSPSLFQNHALFKFSWADVIKRGVQSFWIVETLNVIAGGAHRVFVCFVFFAVKRATETGQRANGKNGPTGTGQRNGPTGTGQQRGGQRGQASRTGNRLQLIDWLRFDVSSNRRIAGAQSFSGKVTILFYFQENRVRGNHQPQSI